MFLLSESELSIPINKIGLIRISLFHSWNEVLNFFNLEYTFNENIIPLITSVLECRPEYYIRKIYNHFNQKTIVQYLLDNPSNNEIKKTGLFGNSVTKSFYLDIENYKCCDNIIYNDTEKLLTCFTYADSNELVRIYSRNTKDTKCTVNIEYTTTAEYYVVIWKFAQCIVELIIRENDKCRLEIVINVTEDNNLISNKIDHVNTILEKLHKIKSSLLTD
jgi:hypothetical protein